MVGTTAALGLGLTALVTAVLGLAWGRPGAVAGFAFGLLATGLQVIAMAIVAPKLKARDFVRVLPLWSQGMMLRFAGIAAVPLAVTYDRAMFPPLAAALGYLGVLIPLLFFEIRRFR